MLFKLKAPITTAEDVILLFVSFATFVVCFFNFKLSFGKTFIYKVERLNIKQRRSHLDLCRLQKPIIIVCGSERVKILTEKRFDLSCESLA